MNKSTAYCLAIVALATASCSVNPARQIPKGLAVAYNVALKDTSGSTNYEVFALSATSGTPQNITHDPAVDWTYMTDSNHLYFISDRDTCYRCYFLYETSNGGKNVRKVSSLQLEDSWMDTRNSGSEIIVSGRNNGTRYQLFLVDAASGAFHQLTNDTAAMYSDPAFSPDGTQIAFSYRENKRDRKTPEEIYVMQVNGANARRLTHYPMDQIETNKHGYKAGGTRWHPSGKFISYISMQEGVHHVYGVNLDGTEQWRLTDRTLSDGWHDWSPDGNWLVFDTADKEESQYDILLMNWKTKKTVNLTKGRHPYQQSPVFLKL